MADGEIGVLLEAVKRVSDRLDAHLAAEAAALVAQRRYTLTTTIAAGGLVLTALGLIGGLVYAVLG